MNEPMGCIGKKCKGIRTMNDFTNIISRPDIMDCEIDITHFQDGCITLTKNKKIVGEYYICEMCLKWFEVDNKHESCEGNIFCSADCYNKYIKELTYEDQFYYDV